MMMMNNSYRIIFNDFYLKSFILPDIIIIISKYKNIKIGKIIKIIKIIKNIKIDKRKFKK